MASCARERQMIYRLLPAAVFPLAVTASLALAHPGRTAADGCHNDRKNGGRHCHGGSVRNAPPAASPQRLSDDAWFPNCAAARAAGAAPVRRGSPGYGRHLDRDGDGIGCE
ncbi:excalibur calcium-binding domain-containing protein [Blastomonas sp. SL216]|uniref:excalibur calcium-binding domain-containing protein n=1 Tax=Blastomonas sp. SL216 TaxID=2995169 RepID=UPI00406A3CB0